MFKLNHFTYISLDVTDTKARKWYSHIKSIFPIDNDGSFKAVNL